MSKPRKWVELPPNFASALRVCTVPEAAAFLRCSEWDVHQRIRKGHITAFKDGSRTKLEVASLVREQDRALASRRIVPNLLPAPPTQPVAEAVVTKRPVGRPRKPRAAEPQPASGRRVLEATS